MKKTIFTLVLTGLILSFQAAAKKDAPQPGVAITIYNQDFAVVKERRLMDFGQGLNRLQFTDVASRIDPTSVLFECLDKPGLAVILEQNYEYDLVNTTSLLKKYIDQPIQVQVKGSGAGEGTLVSGVLLSADGQSLILQEPSGRMNIVSGDSVERIELAKKPEELLTRPTLVWLAQSAEKFSGLCQVAYTTDGLGWQADYTATLSEKEDAIDLGGWVTVTNNSGTSYKDATIKLVAGDVRREAPQAAPMMERGMKMMALDGAGAGFEEKPFMEYHLYTLGRPSTINNNQVKQIELFSPVRDVQVSKIYLFETSVQDWLTRGIKKVQVKIEFQNKKENQLGIALPKGRVRVFKKDTADDSLEFVGEDRIDHTAKDEKVSLYIGDAFDIAAEQTLTDSRNGKGFEIFTRKVEIRNHKEEAVTVFVDEKIPQGRNWRIDKTSHQHEKKDAFTARFAVSAQAGQTAVLEYQMTQTW